MPASHPWPAGQAKPARSAEEKSKNIIVILVVSVWKHGIHKVRNYKKYYDYYDFDRFVFVLLSYLDLQAFVLQTGVEIQENVFPDSFRCMFVFLFLDSYGS